MQLEFDSYCNPNRNTLCYEENKTSVTVITECLIYLGPCSNIKTLLQTSQRDRNSIVSLVSRWLIVLNSMNPKLGPKASSCYLDR